MITFDELLEKLRNVDEIELLELLDITSEDLVREYEDKIEERYPQIVREFYDDEEESSNR